MSTSPTKQLQKHIEYQVLVIYKLMMINMMNKFVINMSKFKSVTYFVFIEHFLVLFCSIATLWFVSYIATTLEKLFENYYIYQKVKL